jgi:hypothetical protein
MIIEKNIPAFEDVLEKRGFVRASTGVWAEPILGNFARIMESKKIRVIHCSGYLFLDENVDSEDAFNAILSALETSSFVPPEPEALSVLAGMTDPKYFICASEDEPFVVVASDTNWVETARQVGSMYTWRTVTKGFNIKLRGKAQFKAAKGEHIGYRKNENGHLFVIKLAGEKPKEYRINKNSVELIEENTKARRGAPPKIKADVAPKKNAPKTPEPKTKIYTAPTQRPDAEKAMEALNEMFGKGVTARQIKAELKEIIELPSWPTTKTALFAAIVKKYSLDIIDILSKRGNAKSAAGKLSEKDRKAFNEIIAFDKDPARFVMRQEGIDFPAGWTNDPDYQTKCVLLLIENLGADRAVELVKTKASELEELKNAHLRKFEEKEMQDRHADIFSRRGSPAAPKARKIVWSPDTPPPQYSPPKKPRRRGQATQKPKRVVEQHQADTQLSKALKLFMKELYEFAGGQIRTVLPGSDRMFQQGNAVREMMQVDTAPSDVSNYSAEQFLEAFTKKFEKSNSLITIEDIERPNPGVLDKDEAELVLKVKGMPKIKLKLHIRVNPKSLDSVFTKHNLMIHQASKIARLRLSKLKNVSKSGHNLTITVTRDDSHPLFS